jgi:hypothetical protein
MIGYGPKRRRRMGQIGQMVAASGGLGQLYARRLLEGVTPKNYARLARPGGTLVQSNHAAFVLGHLNMYPAKVLERLGRPAGATACPAAYAGLFEAGAECRDDPDGSIYPALEELSGRFFDGYTAALRAIGEATDELMLSANSAEGRSRELFPTIGAMLGFYTGGHVATHLGQLSAWRRCIGLTAAM